MAKIEIDGKILSCADEAVEWFVQHKGAKVVEEVKEEAPKKKTRKASKK